jgi:uncharacterized protein (TIGR02246 family)
MMDRLQELLDKDAIREVLVRYAAGVDRRDARMIADCFTPNARAIFAGADFGRGGEAIANKIIEIMKGWKHSTHFIGNQLVELDGDAATMETYAMAYVLAEQGGKERAVVRCLRYHDKLVRSNGRWVIQEREHVAHWMIAPTVYPATALVTFDEDDTEGGRHD